MEDLTTGHEPTIDIMDVYDQLMDYKLIEVQISAVLDSADRVMLARKEK